MKYLGAVTSDIGTHRKTNQDSVCLKIIETKRYGQIALVIICDGMGGYQKGELASAEVVQTFAEWFENQLPVIIRHYSWNQIRKEWSILIYDLNNRIMKYGEENHIRLGTTLSALLCIEDNYLITHIGDTRIYCIDNEVQQLTEDHTVVARQMREGILKKEDAEKSKRKNVLTQCIGCSRYLTPQFLMGKIKPGTVYVCCSDGFRHVINEEEIYSSFQFRNLNTIDGMRRKEEEMIELIKCRGEKDNITVGLLKCMR